MACLVDETSSRQALDPLGPTLAGRTVVNLSSDTPERARDHTAWAARHGIDYLDGVILVPTAVVGTPDVLTPISGPPNAFDRHQVTLQSLGGNLHHLGADPGAASVYDLAMLDIFYSTMAAIVHAFALAESDGVAPTTFAPYATQIIGILPPLITTMASAIEADQHPGDLDRLEMERRGIDHIIEASRARGLDVGVLHAVRTLAERAIAAGHGDAASPASSAC